MGEVTLSDKFQDWTARPSQVYCDENGVLLVIHEPRLADPLYFVAVVGDGEGGEDIACLPKSKKEMDNFFFVGVVDEFYERS